MKRKWRIRLDRNIHQTHWFAKAGNKSTVLLSYFFWTPFGRLEVYGREVTAARYY